MQRFIVTIVICLIFSGCAQNEHFNRGYVISKSHFEEEEPQNLPIEENSPSSEETINP